MHELSVTRHLLEIVLQHAGDAERVTQLNLVIGELSGIVGESVQFYWDIVTKDTKASDSHLNISRVPVEFRCQECSHEFSPGSDGFACPSCDSSLLEIISGKEFFLESIEVE